MLVTSVISPAESGSRGWWTATPVPFVETPSAFKAIWSFLFQVIRPPTCPGEGEIHAAVGFCLRPRSMCCKRAAPTPRGVCVLPGPERKRTGAPRSPERRWAEKGGEALHSFYHIDQQVQ